MVPDHAAVAGEVALVLKRVMSGVPRVSVIVVSYNRARDLRRSLEAIFATRYPALEVIVVDNASVDNTGEVAASFPGVKLIRTEENLGYAGGNNVGIAQAAGEYVALINEDAVIESSWIEDFVRFLESHPDAAAASGKQYFWLDQNSPGDKSLHYCGYSVLEPSCATVAQLDCPDDVREVVTLSSSAVMLRRRAIDDVGEPFLEPSFFMCYEETDFFARALRRGYRLYYWGRPAHWYRRRADAEQHYGHHYYTYRNRLLFAYRHLDDAGLRQVMRNVRAMALLASAMRLGDFLSNESNAGRAARDAWAWAESHRDVLLDHRAKHSKVGNSYSALVSTIQKRARSRDPERSEFAALVPQQARRVIDIGCGSGGLGQKLKALSPGTQVRGIEPVPLEADRARAVLDDVVVAGADVETLPADWPRPDCVIFADAFRYMTDPGSTLRRWGERLAPGGVLFVTIPNVLHHRVLRGMAYGRWSYADSGISDWTHLRFFTRAAALELVERAGFRIERVERVIHMPRSVALAKLLEGRISQKLALEVESGRLEQTPSTTLSDVCTSHFVIVARVNGSADPASIDDGVCGLRSSPAGPMYSGEFSPSLQRLTVQHGVR
jgi:GT2 family glycosyltransferase/ubiquinone/menaquinone biosynthesis C-methylase UbiE